MTPDVPPDSRLTAPDSTEYRRGPHWIALAAAVFTLPLLYVGGSVTTYRVGLAVWDWPTTLGENMFLFDFRNQSFGVRVEHTHRLYGAAVGLFTILLTGWLLAFDRRPWMKGMGVLALAAVIVQGVLGGIRVTRTSTVLAAIHGCTGQAFFGLIVALWVWTSRDWLNTPEPRRDAGRIRPLALGVFASVVAQIAVGSWLRHFGTLPALLMHAGLAVAVFLAVFLLVVRVERGRASLPYLLPSSRAVGILLVVQIVLGIVSFVYLLPFDGTARSVSFYQAVVRTGHQTNGALLLAATVVLSLRTFRHLCSSSVHAGIEGTGGSALPVEPAALNLEGVA